MSTVTGTQAPLISPFTWAQFMGINPWYFGQFNTGFPEDNTAQCRDAFLLNPWQSNNHLTRQDVTLALLSAEYTLADVVNFYPAPRYLQQKVDFPRNYNPLNYNYPYDYKGFPKSVELNTGKIIELGTEALTEINTVNVTRSDNDGDGLAETFTATVTVPSGTAASELIAVFTAADRNNEPLQDWQIYPLRISVSNVTATITGGSYQLAKPDLQLAYDATGLDASDANSYVTQITVYRQTTNTSESGSLIWENVTWLDDCNSTACAITLASGCFGLRQSDYGLVSVTPANYNATLSLFQRTYPERYWRGCDRVLVNYRAGLLGDELNRVPTRYRNAICLLATALLPNRVCGCDRADTRIIFYREMPTDARSNAVVNTQQHIQAVERIFGVTGRGAMEAYQLIKPDITAGGALW